MNELVERYVRQVGRYLPPKERAEIEAELRSQIQDQLDDRYGGTPSQADVASVLAELGDPRQMAASYGREQYLVGPDLYPYMLMVLRQGWLLVPGIVVFLNVFGALISAQPDTLVGLFLETLIAVLQVTFIFSAVVVMIFATIQHSGVELDMKKETFNPLDLPEVDEPASVDRFEAVFGIAFGAFVSLVALYWLRVGGLTLRFDLSNPGEVIPVPAVWLLLMIINTLAMVSLHLLALRRNRWTVGLLLIETLLELVGTVCLYFVLFKPLFTALSPAVPALANLPFIASAPELIAVSSAFIILVGKGGKLLKLWNYRQGSPPPFIIQTGQ